MTNRHRTRSAKPAPASSPRPSPLPPKPPRWRGWALVAGLLITAVLLFVPLPGGAPDETLSYSQLKSDLAAGQVKSVAIASNGTVTGVLTNGHDFRSSYPTAVQDPQFAQLLDAHNVTVSTTQASASAGNVVLSIGLDLLPLVLFGGLLWWAGRRARTALGGGGLGGLGGIGRSRSKVFDTERPTTTFADVAGYEGAKQEVNEIVDVLTNPRSYRQAGAVGPRGVLMVGPPGTGKTLLARAVAGEAKVPFFSVTGSSFVEMFVGVGAARVRDLFEEARRRSPSIVFIDEIDAIGHRRGTGVVGNDERDQTLNQLLAEMDGFEGATDVVVIAATNRPEVLDPALLRPGRFDRQVVVGLPTLPERRAILERHVRGKTLAPTVDLSVVARGTPGFSGADLANLVNEAAIFAVREGRTVVEARDFAGARDRLILGRRDASNALLPEEKHSVAVHESGHAIVAAVAANADPVAKVTILPAGQALGVTEQLPVDERHLYSEAYLRDALAVRMGGRAAERVVLGVTSSGASNDLAGATRLATRMVREFGMSPALGPVSFATDDPDYLGAAGPSRPYAEATQRIVDEEVARLLREADERATAMLVAHRAELDQLVAMLLDRETVDGADVHALVGGRAVAA